MDSATPFKHLRDAASKKAKKKVTLREIAERAGKTETTIRNYEALRTVPTLSEVANLAHAYDTTPAKVEQAILESNRIVSRQLEVAK